MAVGPLMLDLIGTSLSNEECELLLRPEVGGVIFFSRNLVSRKQIIELTGEIAELRPSLLLAVDQEGGRVQRLREGYTPLPSMQILGDLFRENEQAGSELLRDVGWLMAVEVIASGIDFSFAPVLDIDRNTCRVIGDRAISDDPQLACRAIKFFVDGMHEAGMAATGKHFPGHGGVSGDSHLETPLDSREMSELNDRDLIPFSSLAGHLEGIMPAHIIFPNIDDQAVGFSHYWLQDILRGQLGFSGVIFSDDLSMKGADVVGGYKAKATSAMAAGCDMVLVCNNRAGAREVLEFFADNPKYVNPESGARGVLAKMKAKHAWQWPDLENNTRRRATIATLQTIS
jgi:beta-N-acetylhexosaminidase